MFKQLLQKSVICQDYVLVRNRRWREYGLFELMIRVYRSDRHEVQVNGWG